MNLGCDPDCHAVSGCWEAPIRGNRYGTLTGGFGSLCQETGGRQCHECSRGRGDAEPGGEADQVTVLAVPPEGFELADADCPSWLRLMSEQELLKAFWALASKAECVVSYNGRGFDVPFVVTRSLIHGIPARVDLVSGRWSLKPHLDLFELVSQRGRGPSKLDVVCWALGIESPKEVMDGSMVAPAYQRGEIVKIAEYNAHDVRATSAVYRKCRDLILRYRSDWR